MPHLGVELHDGRLERVHVRDLDVDCVCAAGIWGIWGAWEGAFKMCEIAGVDRGCEDARVVLVLLDVAELLEDAALACARHCEMCCAGTVAAAVGDNVRKAEGNEEGLRTAWVGECVGE